MSLFQDDNISAADARSGKTEEAMQSDDDEVFIAFSRVFSGAVRQGMEVYILGPKYKAQFPDRHCTRVVIEGVFVCMCASRAARMFFYSRGRALPVDGA